MATGAAAAGARAAREASLPAASRALTAPIAALLMIVRPAVGVTAMLTARLAATRIDVAVLRATVPLRIRAMRALVRPVSVPAATLAALRTLAGAGLRARAFAVR